MVLIKEYEAEAIVVVNKVIEDLESKIKDNDDTFKKKIPVSAGRSNAI